MLLSQFLVYDPTVRLSAQAALLEQYFFVSLEEEDRENRCNNNSSDNDSDTNNINMIGDNMQLSSSPPSPSKCSSEGVGDKREGSLGHSVFAKPQQLPVFCKQDNRVVEFDIAAFEGGC